MRTTLLIALVLGFLIGLTCLSLIERGGGGISFAASKPAPVLTEQKAVAFHSDRVAADGVVEGAKPEAAIRPDVSGILAAVHVRENQDVTRGTLLAELENEVQKQKVALAVAELSRARSQLVRLRNGERPERRKAAAAIEEAREVVLQQTRSEWERSRKLAENRSASREEFDRSYFTMLRARAERDEAAAERALVDAPARADEIAIEEATVAAAETRLRLAEAELGKTRVLAPSDGRVLQIFAEPGEQAGPASVHTVQPILLLADLSKRRVRAFVEELDATRVENGQRAQITADGLPGREFEGTVVLVTPRMGQRGPRSDAAGEYKDLYFREALIELDAGDELPINLRVQVRIRAHPQRTVAAPG
jgi:multidrug resistance efflux pump